VALLGGPNSAIIYEEQAPSGLSPSPSSVMLHGADDNNSPRPMHK
jgi:hypothetical protein